MHRLAQLPLLFIAALIVLPVLVVLASALQWNTESAQILQEMAGTVLPQYAITSVALCILVGLGVALLGSATACAVTLFDFKGRKTFEWALLLPIAMPAYVVAYAYTDFLQFAGPAQSFIRSAFNLQGRVLPDVRSLGGAVLVFVFTLYPYVYLLARTALSERAAHLMEAARVLGAPLRRRIASIALPLARPAIAAGTALALMETLADFGVSSYFGIQSFSAGIYKAWLAMDNRIAAAQLAALLLVFVAVLLKLERHSRQRLRFAATKGARAGSAEARPVALHGKHLAIAWLVCAVPVLLGFVLPVLMMLRPLVQGLNSADAPLPWGAFGHWAFNSLKLASIAAVLAVGMALAMAFVVRRSPNALTRGVVTIAGMGYAVPGAVIVVGLLIPVGALQAAQPSWGIGYVVTATVLGVVWAYLVRFSAVALQSVQSGYTRVPMSFDDSARTLGVTGFALLRRVHWPLLRRSTLVATLLVFVDVMKELPATLVLRPFNHDTLAVMAYQLARDERLGEAALPSLALVLVGLIPVVLLSRSLRDKT
ncbi:MAG: iron ABC transporter permease [Burkholderiaceae bacterium]